MDKSNASSSFLSKEGEFRKFTFFCIILMVSFLLLPGPLYVAILTLIVVISPRFKSHSVAFITIFYFSFLICSRYSGNVWNGSDDLPSYFLAYDAITSGSRDAVSASFFFAKHLDFGFIGFTSIVNYISGGNRFIYYFSVVFCSFTIYYIFLFRVLGGRFSLFALILFFLYFKNIHLSMHILRSSLAVPLILLSLSFVSYKRYLVYIIGGSFQASSAVLAVLTLIKRDMIKRFSFTKKLLLIIIGVIAFLSVGNIYLFGKINNANFSIGIGNYPIILVNIVIGLGVILAVNKKLFYRDNGKMWVYIYMYFLLVSLLSLLFKQHTYRFSHYVLYLTPMIIALGVSSGKKIDLFLYTLVVIYFACSYFTYYYVINLNESDFYYRSGSDVLINGVEQLQLFFKYVVLDVEYSSWWRVEGE